MANKITLEFEVTDKGTLKQVTSDTNKLSKAVKDSSHATDQASNSKNRYSKLEKGSAQLTSNSTKSFAKQAQTIGSGLVPAYATLAANIFAVSAAFGALKRAAGLEQLEAGLIAVGSAAGQNLPYIADQLREITGAAISTQSAMESVALGTSAGFSTTQMEELTRVAKGASLALGRDMEDAMSRLVRGAAKLEPEILDELGIMVRIDDVTRNYAETLGKTADSLTNFERRMAFTNAIIDQGTDKFGQIAEKIDPNPYNQLAARFADLTKNVLQLMNTGLGPFLDLLASNTYALVGVVALFGTSVASKMLPAMFEAGEAAADAAENLGKVADAQLRNIDLSGHLPKSMEGLNTKIKEGTLSYEEQSKVVKNLDQSQDTLSKHLKTAIRDHGRESEIVTEKTKKLENVTRIRKDMVLAMVANNKAEAKATQAAALEEVAQGRLRNALGLTRISYAANRAAMQTNMKIQKGFVKGLSAIRIGLFGVTSALKLVGTAFLKFLPFIGLAITGFSALKAGWDKLFGKSEAQKQVDEIVESFESFTEVNETLDDTIANIELMSSSMTESKRNAELYTASLKAQAGVYGQIAEGIEKVLDLEKKKEMEVIKSLRRDLRELENDLTSEEITKLKAGGEAAQRVMDANNKMFGRNKATEYYFALQNLEEKMNDLGEASRSTAASIADNLLENAIINIESNKTISEAMQEELRLYKQYQEVLREFANDPEIVQEVKKAIDNMAGSTKQAVAELEGLSETSRKFNIEFTKLLKADERPFENVLDSLAQISSALNNASSDSDRLKVVWEELPADIIEVLGTTPDLQGLESYISKWEEASTAIANAERNAKKFEDEAKGLEGLLDIDPSLVDDYYKALDRSVQAQITALEKYKEQIEDQAGAKDKILEIDRKISELDKEKSSVNAQNITYIESYVSQYKTLEKLSSKVTENTQARLAAELSLKEEQLRMTAGEDGEITAREELEIFEALKASKIEAAQREAEIKKKSIDSEYLLAELQFELLRQEFALADKKMPEAFESNYRELLDQGKSSAIAAVEAETQLALQMIESTHQDKFNSLKEAAEDLAETFSGIEFDFDLGDSADILGDLGDYADTAKGVLGLIDTYQELPEIVNKEAEAIQEVMEWRDEALANAKNNAQEQNRVYSDAADKQKQIEQDAARSKLAIYAQYASGVGGILSSLAETQDQTSKEGFETAKKMQMAAAVVNTAGAVMNALATVQPYPAAVAAAAVAAATGAAQIAQISSTEFGDSGEVSASTGSMSAGFSVGGKSVQSTVLGSSDFSESYAKTDELLEEIHAKEYYQLRAISDGIDNLNSGVKGLNLSLVRDIPEWGDQQRGSTLGEYYAEAGMGSGWYTYGASVTSGDITLQDVLAGKPIPLTLETTARQTKSSTIRDYEFDLIEGAGEAYTEQTANIQRLWENMYTEVASSTTDLAMMFGKSADEINALTMKGIGVEIISGATDHGHSSTWVSPEDLEKRLQEAYSTMGDMLIEDILGDWLKGYQQLEEGLAETGFRVASTNVVIQEFLDYLDYGFKDLAQEVEVSMDLADQAGGLKDFQEAAETFSNSFTSEADRFARSSFQLEKIFEGYNLSLPKTRDAFVELMGTFDLTTEKGRDIFSSLLTSIDMLEEYYAHLEEVEEKRAELETSIIAGLEGEYAALQMSRELELETLKELNPELVKIQERAWAVEILNTQYDMEIELLNALGKSEDALALQRIKELSALDPSLRALQKQIWATEDATQAEEKLANTREEALKEAESALKKAFEAEKDRLTEIFDDFMESLEKEIDKTSELIGTLSSAVSTLESSVESMQEVTRQTYLDATMQIRSLTAEAKAGRYGGLEDLSSLTGTLTSDTSQIYGSYEEYRRDRLRAQVAMANLQEELEGQLTIEERTLEVLEDRKWEAKSQHERELENLDRQLNSILGIRDVVLTIPEATRQYEAAKRAHEAAILAIEERKEEQLSTINSSIVSLSDIMSEFSTGVYASIEAAAQSAAAAASAEADGAVASGELTEAQKSAKGFADGGLHTGGWRLVGEEGPELEYTGRSQIYSNSNTKKMLDFSALAEEIKELRTDLKYANYQIAKNTGDTAKLMNRWDGDGLPEERVI